MCIRDRYNPFFEQTTSTALDVLSQGYKKYKEEWKVESNKLSAYVWNINVLVGSKWRKVSIPTTKNTFFTIIFTENV